MVLLPLPVARSIFVSFSFYFQSRQIGEVAFETNLPPLCLAAGKWQSAS